MNLRLKSVCMVCVVLQSGCAGPKEKPTSLTLPANVEGDRAQPVVMQVDATAETIVETALLPQPLSEIEDPELLRKAIVQLHSLAEQGNAEASFQLGKAHYHGWGVEVSAKEAFNYFLTSANAGHSEAQYCVAMMYHNGDGTAKDGGKALHWCEASAKQENSLAQFWLGAFHEYGIYVRQDEETACRYYAAAADQGLLEAQTQLGICYALGKGIEKDMHKSRALLEIAKRGAMDMHGLRDDLWQQAVEIDEYPAKRIVEHQEKFAELKRHMDPAAETYLGPNNTWVFRTDSVLSRQELEFDQLMSELLQSKPQRDRQIKRLLGAIELIDEIIQNDR